MRSRGGRWRNVRDQVLSQVWPAPAFALMVAVALGVMLPSFDSRLVAWLPDGVDRYLFRAGPDTARGVLAAVAGSLVTVTSLTFSLTVITLQLASSQYSPRVLRTFTQDRVVHVTLAVLLGTFTFAMTVMQTIRTDFNGRSAFVPRVSVTLAYVLALASVITLVLFLAHLSRKIRIESMLRDVHRRATDAIEAVFPERRQPELPPVAVGPDGRETVLLHADTSGFLIFIDETQLMAAATEVDGMIHVFRQPGDSVIADTPVAIAWPLSRSCFDEDAYTSLRRRASHAVRVGFERNGGSDVAFGLRQIVDIAVRALSPGINDPTTAVHALSHASALLCQLADRSTGPRVRCDESGRARLVLDQPDLVALLGLVIAQPSHYGAQDPDVLARLLALLQEVAWSTTVPRERAAVREELDALQATAREQRFRPADQVRLEKGVAAVHDALQGQWSVPAPQHPGRTDRDRVSGRRA
ncbi:DUF2254 domain-containing protein [Luedemannella flava]|uniref:DUF2254 domain-containing protein n=1 Tax=Luedemannella flava TaxID=349316 RepID=A0ABN2LWH3_9ACTN